MGNGQYGIVFEPKGPGRYVIGVKHNGQHVKDSPFHINVGGQPAAAPAPSQQQQPAQQQQQQSVKFPFACKLQDGTPFTPKSLSEFEVKLHSLSLSPCCSRRAARSYLNSAVCARP
jgi:hypothetical protein